MGKGREKEIIICICGMAGSGKSTVARRIAEHYGLKYCSGGDALKAIAMERGYNAQEQGWWESEEGIQFLKERMENPDFDKMVDEKLIEMAGEGGVVLDSWTMPWLLDRGFKVWLEASEEIRAKRVASRDGLPIEEAIKMIKEKEQRTKAIYERLYGFMLGEDMEPFDLIIDVNLLDADEVFQILRMAIDNLVIRGKQRDPHSQVASNLT
ncbi:cytidylate kinase [Candidatus Bathyarchaeota archaeon]|nr:MAG: cytidylate kinase [Candidatus Bathyarchaeota archaeon]